MLFGRISVGSDNIRYLFVVIASLFCLEPVAQNEITWEEFVADYVAENEEQVPEALLDELSEIHASRININTADSVTFLQFPFLDLRQIHSICVYLARYAPLQTLSELQLIPGLDYRTRRYLSLFFYCGAMPRKRTFVEELWKGNHEVTTRLDIPLYRRDGYKNYSRGELLEHPNKQYLGNALYNSLRYRYHYGDRVYYGVTLEKDSGEPFGYGGNYPYDSYSGYFMYKPKKTLYSLVVGDYRLHFGEGLAFGNYFGTYRQDPLRQTGGIAAMLKKHTSTSESDYFRGVAAMLKVKRLYLVPFVSYRAADAILYGDSAIRSLKTDGYHRTRLEHSRKNNISTWCVGSHLGWYTSLWAVGATAARTEYSLPFIPHDALYRRYALKGRTFSSYSANYMYRGRMWMADGEVAFTEKGALAMLHTLRCGKSERLNLILQPRFYSYRYATPYSSAYHTGSGVQNEEGLYAYAGSRVFPRLFVELSGDYAYHPWATYRCSSSSVDWNVFFRSEYTLSPNSSISSSYQLKMQERDDVKGSPGRICAYRHKAKIQWAHDSRHWRQVCALDGVCNRILETNYGWMASGRLYWKNKRCKVAVAASYYHTDSYDERIYCYEPMLLYAMSFPVCYYHGVSGVSTLDLNISRHIRLSCKYKIVHYFDRSQIGTAQQRINSGTKQDLSLQVRCLF